MIKKVVEVIEIDTKEICLLCYDPCVKGDGEEVIKRASSLTGLKQLLRYLKVDTKQLFNCSPGILQWMEIKHEIDVQITLCNNCSLVTEEFDKVYKEYELIQFQFNKCLASLHQLMKSGDNNLERVREFQKQMQPNKSFDLINASIAANLRDEAFKKCSLKLGNSLPRVTVQKITDVASNDINQTPIKLTEHNNCRASDDNQLEAVSEEEKNNENDQDIEDWEAPAPYDQSFEVSEVDPLEPDDNFFEDQDADDQPIILFSSSLSQASEMTYPLTSNQPIPVPIKTSPCLVKVSKTCDICKKVFAYGQDLRRHLHSSHPEHVIFRHFSSNSTLSPSLTQCKDLATKFFEHAVTKSAKIGKAIHCYYCAAILSRSQVFKAHLLSQHIARVADVAQKLNPLTTLKPRTVGADKCDQCSKVFASKAQLNKHRLIHSKIYTCQYCSYSNPYPGNVKFHELRIHIVEVVTPHMAPIGCPIKFSQGVTAYYKKLLKMGTRCRICGCQLADKRFLQRHILQNHFHEFLKQLKDYLDHGQLSEDDGNENEKVHENLLEYFCCQFCSFNTKHSDAVKRHELEMHTVDLIMEHLPPGTCNIKCAQGVEAYQENLKRMGTQCPICVSVFETNADLQWHILSHHFDELVRELKDYLEESRGGSGDGGVEGSRQKKAIPPLVDLRIMEFENVKLEVETTDLADNTS